VRFALTSEAGLNDGLAFPLTYAAVALAAAVGSGWSADWAGAWAVKYVAFKCTVGVLCGLSVGRLLGGCRQLPALAASTSCRSS
jgi:NhaP-type Na+/H+ or K+/H+ antiporter